MMRPVGQFMVVTIIVCEYNGIVACVAHQANNGLCVHKTCIALHTQNAIAVVEGKIGFVFREARVDARQQPSRVICVGYIGFKDFYRHTWFI